MNNPVDTSEFTHFLLFESLGHTEPYQIFEPSGFPEIAYSLNKKEEGFARDFSFIASGDKAVKFTNAVGERGSRQQVINPQGKVSEFLDHGLAWILESKRVAGFEAKIKYILKKNGIFFDAGYLSCVLPDTDGYTYFGCNIIQDHRIGNYARQEDTTINVWSTRNFRNELITAAPVLKFLRKAVSFRHESKLGMTANFHESQTFLGTDTLLYYPIVNVESSDVASTVGPYQKMQYMASGATLSQKKNAIRKTKIISAKSRYIDMKIAIENLNWTTTSAFGTFERKMILAYGNDPIDDWTEVVLHSDAGSGTVAGTFTYTIPVLEIGQEVWFYFSHECTVDPLDDLTFPFVEIDIVQNVKIHVVSNSVSLDTVVSGVRQINMMKQCSKFIEDVPVNAPRWSFGGEFYDQVCFNRAGISQNVNVPFVTTYKDCFSNVQEVCGDYENKVNEIFVGQFPDFYENVEIGVFKIRADSQSKKSWNPLTLINKVLFGFDKYQEDSHVEQNSLEDVHTEAELIIPNEMASNTLERKFKYIRSAYLQQEAVDLEIQKPTTADSGDDDVYIADLVPLEPDAFGSFGAILSVQIIDGQLKILNQKSDGEEDDVVINWTILGFQPGATFEITEGANVGTYTVFSNSRTLLTLNPVGFVPVLDGDRYMKFKYFYSGITYKTRSDEGFTLIENISNPSTYPNLKFTIRRCLSYWESILNTACSFARNKVIRYSYVKSNGRLKSQYMTDPIYTEGQVLNLDGTYSSTEIPVTLLQPRIIGPEVDEIHCVCTYEEAVTFLQNYNTTRGFIRAYDINDVLIKGFFSEFEFFPGTETLTLRLEEKFEDKILLLTYADGILTVFGTPYDLGGNVSWWNLENGFFKAYDANGIPVCNWKSFDEVSLNSTIYGTADDLLAALTEL